MGLFDGTPLEHVVPCTTCGLLAKACQCPPPPSPDSLPLDAAKQRVRLAVERRAKGKSVTVVKGLQGSPKQLQTLLKSLKDHCGTGGTVAGQNLEIQGDQLQRLRKWLGTQGFQLEK